MGLPGTHLNLDKNSRKQNLKILNFEFCLSFKSAPCSLHFPLLRTLKDYFLYAKIFFKYCPRLAWKLFFFMLKYFFEILNFFLGILNFQTTL